VLTRPAACMVIVISTSRYRQRIQLAYCRSVGEIDFTTAPLGLALAEPEVEAASTAGFTTVSAQAPTYYIASIEARVVTRSFLLPSFEICRNASTP
jgi:hypothetical protein